MAHDYLFMRLRKYITDNRIISSMHSNSRWPVSDPILAGSFISSVRYEKKFQDVLSIACPRPQPKSQHHSNLVLQMSLIGVSHKPVPFPLQHAFQPFGMDSGSFCHCSRSDLTQAFFHEPDRHHESPFRPFRHLPIKYSSAQFSDEILDCK